MGRLSGLRRGSGLRWGAGGDSKKLGLFPIPMSPKVCQVPSTVESGCCIYVSLACV